MPRELTTGEIREEEQRQDERERKMLRAARDHLLRRVTAGYAVNLDHLRALVNGGAKDHKSYFMWARLLVRGWEAYGLPADVLARALQQSPAELDVARDVNLFVSVPDAELARALGRAGRELGHDQLPTDPDTVRLVEKLARSLELTRESGTAWRHQP